VFEEKYFSIDRSRQLFMEQHSRGKVLKFGSVVIPIVEDAKSSKSLIRNFFLSQRGFEKYERSIRVDGISNPDKVLEELNQIWQDER